MSAAAAAVLAVPGLVLCAVGGLWLRAPARLLDGVLSWAAATTGKEPRPPDGAVRAARALGSVLLLAGVLLLARAALVLVAGR